MVRSVLELQEKLKNKQLSCQQYVGETLDRIQSCKNLNAILEVNPLALKLAEATDSKIKASKPLGLLEGVPITIKDMICVEGLKTTAGSKMLENFVAPYSATLVKRLQSQGAIIVGKCNQDEFAMGSSNEHSYFGSVRNPWNEDFVPGGSSGGSAAAVAAGLGLVSIGTDTGGSIRQPAHFCGVVGLKPTYGRISRYGVVAYASSLDQAGPLANSVADAAISLEAMSGFDKMDATSSRQPVSSWSKNLSTILTGRKVGIPLQLKDFSLQPETQNAFETAKQSLISAGAEVVDIDLPMLKFAVPVYYLIAASEASSNLARYDGVRYGYRSDFTKQKPESLIEFYAKTRGEGFGSEVKRRIIMGTYFLSSGYYDAYFKKASQVRRLIYEESLRTFKKCDVILSPVSTSAAFKIGEKLENPLDMYLNDVLTVSSNLVGQPSISVPVLKNNESLPVGVQLIGQHFGEQSLFDFAQAIESQVKFDPMGGSSE